MGLWSQEDPMQADFCWKLKLKNPKKFRFFSESIRKKKKQCLFDSIRKLFPTAVPALDISNV